MESRKILLIKPYRVSAERTERAVEQFKSRYPQAKIALMANLSPEEYKRLSANRNIDEKIFYRPDARRLTKLELVRLLSKLRRIQFDQAVVLEGSVSYLGYKKAKLIAGLSGSKEVSSYSEERGEIRERAGLSGLLLSLLFLPLRTVVLCVFLVFFLIFIVGGLRVRRVLYTLRKG